VIFTVALIAIGRKIIIFDPKDYDGLQMIGVAAIIVSLVVLRGNHDRFTRRGS